MDFYVILESNTGVEDSGHLSLDEYQMTEGLLYCLRLFHPLLNLWEYKYLLHYLYQAP